MANDNENRQHESDDNKGQMSVSEAGQKGGQRVHDLVEEGKEQEGSSNRSEREEDDSQ